MTRMTLWEVKEGHIQNIAAEQSGILCQALTQISWMASTNTKKGSWRGVVKEKNNNWEYLISLHGHATALFGYLSIHPCIIFGENCKLSQTLCQNCSQQHWKYLLICRWPHLPIDFIVLLALEKGPHGYILFWWITLGILRTINNLETTFFVIQFSGCSVIWLWIFSRGMVHFELKGLMNSCKSIKILLTPNFWSVMCVGRGESYRVVKLLTVTIFLLTHSTYISPWIPWAPLTCSFA